MTEANPIFMADFMQNLKLRYERCMEPTATCTAPSIKAHSIQNSRTIDLIQENNKVYMMGFRPSLSGPNLDLRLVGRNQASTFTGLCSHHDSNIFRPIDTEVLDFTNNQHLFLLSYRSVLKEYHAIMEGAYRLQSMLHKAVTDGLVKADEMSPPMAAATEAIIRGYAFYRYKVEHFDLPFVQQNFQHVKHDVIRLSNQPPRVAASTFNSLESIISRGGLTGIVINILPTTSQETVVILSYAETHAAKARASSSVQTILQSSGEYQKYEISRHLISATENFMLNPQFVDSWTTEKKATIVEAFKASVGNFYDIGTNPEFMLF